MIIDKRSRVPIYEQIINQYKALIACGVIKTGDQLESVRNLSTSLEINPNTIQKAYSELENQYICISAPGKGRFVTADAKNIIKSNARTNSMGIDKEILNLALSGLSHSEIEEIIQKAIQKANNKINTIKATRKDKSYD